MNGLKGKVAVVTGGSRDIGRAISMKLAAEGAKVCINYCHNEAKALETLDAIKGKGGEAILVKADVSRSEDVKKLFEETAKAFGGQIDILVNNAGGIVGRKGIEEQDEEWYQKLMDLNFKSCWLCTRDVLPYMKNGGSIVNISSQAARDGGGPDGSGHFVKMVHNGIEYGDIELICECYHLMRDGLGMSNPEMQETFMRWNEGELGSYLIGITAQILGKKDSTGNGFLIDSILDNVGQKGTGKWTVQAALDEGIPLTLIGEAAASSGASSSTPSTMPSGSSPACRT